MANDEAGCVQRPVAPHAGAWIEMSIAVSISSSATVAPHAGAWIEMFGACIVGEESACRAPRGRVD